MPGAQTRGAFDQMSGSRGSRITQDVYDKKAHELKEEQGRDRHSHRAAPARRRRVSDNTGKPDFAGFAGCRAVRAFENRAKAATHRLRLFDLVAQGKKARVFIPFALRPDGRSAILFGLAALPGYISNYVPRP